MLLNFRKSVFSLSRTNFKEFHLFSYLNSETIEKNQETNNQKSDKNLENNLNEIEKKLIKCEEEKLELKDKYLRAIAEVENTRIRMRRQIDDAKSFGIQGFCKDLLEVADILNLAIKNTDPNKSNVKQENENLDLIKEQLNSMHQGLVMTENRLLKIFEKHGLVQIKPKDGDKFDPNLHEAIFRIPIPDKQSGTVNVLSKIGFKLHERVVRAAQVGVVQ